jgi:hypothetical protein
MKIYLASRYAYVTTIDRDDLGVGHIAVYSRVVTSRFLNRIIHPLPFPHEMRLAKQL